MKTRKTMKVRICGSQKKSSHARVHGREFWHKIESNPFAIKFFKKAAREIAAKHLLQNAIEIPQNPETPQNLIAPNTPLLELPENCFLAYLASHNCCPSQPPQPNENEPQDTFNLTLR
jgi:hypothetical protein